MAVELIIAVAASTISILGGIIGLFRKLASRDENLKMSRENR